MCLYFGGWQISFVYNRRHVVRIIHCYITRAKTERNLTRKIQLFSSRLLVSLYTAPSKNICIFLRCGFHGVMLHIKAFASRWLTLHHKGASRALMQYCFVIGSKGLWFREKLKIETSQDLIVGCRLDSGRQKVISPLLFLKTTWISPLFFTIFAKKCLAWCVRTYSPILNISPVCTVSA